MTEPTVAMVRVLIDEQFPQWRGTPVRPVARQGWDNRTFRIGDDHVARLPSAEGYVAAVAKEDRWLPLLARHSPLPVPQPVAVGRPGAGYPFTWSVRRWLSGEPLSRAVPADRAEVARDVGRWLAALRHTPVPPDAPIAGRHSWFRGCHPGVYGDEVADALAHLGDTVDAAACRAIWSAALESTWTDPPVWFHGDVAVGNLLVRDGRLGAVIDFGTCGVGDPACDLVIAWTWCTRDERAIFADSVDLPTDVWRRGRGWALWKALITLAGVPDPDAGTEQRRALAALLADPVRD